MLDSSSDGKHLAYVHQAQAAAVKKVTFDPLTQTVLTEPVEITPAGKQAARPNLSPDGEWVAFNSGGREEDIFVVRSDGSAMRQLTGDGAKNRGPQFSPDGKRIAFFSKRSGTPEIWAIGLDGNNLQRLTFLSGPNVAWPIWSPDGRRLIYTVFGTASFVLDLRKPWGEQQAAPLEAPPAQGSPFYAWSWSPDGTKVAGVQQRQDGTSAGILVYHFSSGKYTKVSDSGIDPVWLSDNRRLVLNQRGRLQLIDTETKASREILSIAPSDIAPRGFSVSKDDRTIYFSVATTTADIWLLSFDEN
jgi:eukaryotic-like serine/threonine-protein kinase